MSILLTAIELIKELFEEYWLQHPGLICTPNYVCRIIYNLYKNDYVCSCKRRRIWYLFADHGWAIVNEWQLHNQLISQMISQLKILLASFDSCQCPEKWNQLRKLIDKLGKYSFQSQVITQCREIFYDSNFETLLNQNIYLIGFENGVYDLKTSELRDGRREDYLSLSTGINYRRFNDTDLEMVELNNYLSQLFGTSKIIEKVLDCSSQILGEPRDLDYGEPPGEIRSPETFKRPIIWYGTGSNGRTGFYNLHKLAMGPYLFRCPLNWNCAHDWDYVNISASIHGIYIEQHLCNKKMDLKDFISNYPMKDFTSNYPNIQLIYCTNQLPSDLIREKCDVIDFLSIFSLHPKPENQLEYPIEYRLSDHLDQLKEVFMFILLEYVKYGKP